MPWAGDGLPCGTPVYLRFSIFRYVDARLEKLDLAPASESSSQTQLADSLPHNLSIDMSKAAFSFASAKTQNTRLQPIGDAMKNGTIAF